MKQNDMLLLVGAGVVLYLLAKNSTGLSAAQASINSANLTAMNTASNAAAIGNAAGAVGNDISSVFTDLS
jgi:hypothetical protein